MHDALWLLHPCSVMMSLFSSHWCLGALKRFTTTDREGWAVSSWHLVHPLPRHTPKLSTSPETGSRSGKGKTQNCWPASRVLGGERGAKFWIKYGIQVLQWIALNINAWAYLKYLVFNIILNFDIKVNILILKVTKKRCMRVISKTSLVFRERWMGEREGGSSGFK